MFGGSVASLLLTGCTNVEEMCTTKYPSDPFASLLKRGRHETCSVYKLPVTGGWC